ncbi:MAG: 2-amino-4-hydroxy-6-hydroxymethyldihydropteridine diphosphokinase [Bacteroidia bacterium]
MTAKRWILLSLGSNIGDREEQLRKAALNIREKLRVQDMICSSVYSTAPWGKTDQPEFLNMVIGFTSTMDAVEMMEEILSVETALGRSRAEKWGPRTIDIDMLYAGNEIIDHGILTLPHPGITERKFVLLPLAEIAPDFKDPRSGITVREMLANCNDVLMVEKVASFTL